VLWTLLEIEIATKLMELIKFLGNIFENKITSPRTLHGTVTFVVTAFVRTTFLLLVFVQMTLLQTHYFYDICSNAIRSNDALKCNFVIMSFVLTTFVSNDTRLTSLAVN